MVTSNFDVVREEKNNNTIFVKLNIDNQEPILIPLIDIILKLENMKGKL